MGNEEKTSKKLSVIVGIFAALTAATFSYVIGWEQGNRKAMPSDTQVQSGYIAPSNLEIECKDLDGNGEPETIIKVDGMSYLLKYDANGNPVIQAYDIKPAEIIPR